MCVTRSIQAVAGALLLLATAPLPARSQAVSGTVEFDGDPERVLVTILTSQGEAVARTVTDHTGAFSVAAPAAGEYELRVDRVGYRSWTSDAVGVESDGADGVELEAPWEPADLPSLAGTGDLSCVVRPEGDGLLAAAWTQARTALRMAAWSLDGGEIVYDAYVHSRQLAPDGRRVLLEPAPRLERGATRITSTLDPAELVRTGFVIEEATEEGGYRFFGPDPAVLVHDDFLDTHCLRLRQDGWPALVGIAFEPRADRSLPDVGGVLWMEAASASLVALEFGYRNLDMAVDLSRLGGQTLFSRLPDGTWFTLETWLTLPMLQVQREDDEDTWVLYRLAEEGVRVLQVTSEGEAWGVQPSSATLEGTILDHQGEPLPGASVSLLGTEYVAETDDQGGFSMSGLLDGVYRVRYDHDRVPGLAVEPREVTLSRGATATLSLEAPSPQEVAMNLCQSGAPTHGQSVIITGQVTDSLTGEALAGIPLSLRFRDPRRDNAPDHEARISSGAGGEYVYCDAPPGERVRIKALTAGHEDRDTSVVAVGETVRLDLVVPLVTEQGPGGIYGTVSQARTGNPIEGAEVRLQNTEIFATTNANGFYSFLELPSGLHVLEVDHPAYQGREVVVTLSGGQAFQVNVDLAVDAIPVEGIEVNVVTRRFFQDMVDLQHRMELGGGTFITRNELKDRQGNLTNILQAMAGAQVLNEGAGSSVLSGKYVVLRDVQGLTGARCFPAIVVDGQRYSQPRAGGVGHTPEDISVFLASQLEAVEVYKGASTVPARFGGGDAPCGAIVIWTRRGGQSGGGGGQGG